MFYNPAEKDKTTTTEGPLTAETVILGPFRLWHIIGIIGAGLMVISKYFPQYAASFSTYDPQCTGVQWQKSLATTVFGA